MRQKCSRYMYIHVYYNYVCEWPSNESLIFSTELQNLKPCGEISLTLDDNNVWILLEPLMYIIMYISRRQESKPPCSTQFG